MSFLTRDISFVTCHFKSYSWNPICDIPFVTFAMPSQRPPALSHARTHSHTYTHTFILACFICICLLCCICLLVASLLHLWCICLLLYTHTHSEAHTHTWRTLFCTYTHAWNMTFRAWRRVHTLQHTATHCNILQHTAKNTATHFNTLQHAARQAATHCHTQQDIARETKTLQKTFRLSSWLETNTQNQDSEADIATFRGWHSKIQGVSECWYVIQSQHWEADIPRLRAKTQSVT